MGGASAQIAFLPEGDPLANMFPVTLNGVDYKLYAHSYLAYGQDYAKHWQVQYLWQTQGGGDTVNHPCLFQGKCCILLTDIQYLYSRQLWDIKYIVSIGGMVDVWALY